ncbi:hypothetical protein CDL12_10779 [Handroanthus impetiginosus]|uniref:Uncharacterized protein n=1 Tax=Handroanthus impetiginosus TaxID=429701 RepID=A0A2G9HGL5_9LAMI|nr:hypothetical protein CDL12_10779 [Handroanthus impetiginosus]
MCPKNVNTNNTRLPSLCFSPLFHGCFPLFPCAVFLLLWISLSSSASALSSIYLQLLFCIFSVKFGSSNKSDFACPLQDSRTYLCTALQEYGPSKELERPTRMQGEMYLTRNAPQVEYVVCSFT